MNTTQLECFMAVANFLNFSRAAQQLRITQPAVSHQINTLEDELGVKLFHRTSKSVRMTQEGFQFTHYAGEILKLTDLSRARMKEAQKEAPQRLVVGCRNTGELRLLIPALDQLRREEPQLLPVLRLIPFDSLENLLVEGEIHLMFSFAGTAPKRARYWELRRCPVCCVCAPGHHLAGEGPVHMEELRRGGKIAVCRPPICPEELFAVQSQAVGGRGVGEVLFCDNQEVLFTLVEAGYAFGITADVPGSQRDDLCRRPIVNVEPLSFGAISLPGDKTPGARRLIKLLEEILGDPAVS